MGNIMKRLIESTEESQDVCNFEKRQKRTEFMSGTMGAHQHRVSLFIKKDKLVGKTERVGGHVHVINMSLDKDGDMLGFTGITENHKHRIKHRIVKDKKKK